MNPGFNPIRRCIACAAAALAVLSALAAGCSSPPATRYYTLMPPPTAGDRAAAAPRLDWTLLPVVVPAQIDQPQWVVRKPDGSLAVLEQERWIAPLGDELRGAIVERLTRSLGPPRAAASADGAPQWRIRVEVQRFDLIPNQEARLAADWSVRGEGAATICHADISKPVPGLDYIDLARGQQRAISQLADAIGAALLAASKGQAIKC
jgi:uncharacterized lipoprotein YmbA